MLEATIAAGAILVLAAAYGLIRRARRSPGRPSIRDEALDASATWIASKTGAAIGTVRDALRSPDAKAGDGALQRVLRIDVVVRRNAPGAARVSAAVALRRDDGKADVGAIEWTVPWDELPDDLRARFLREPERKELAFVLLDPPGEGKEDA